MGLFRFFAGVLLAAPLSLPAQAATPTPTPDPVNNPLSGYSSFTQSYLVPYVGNATLTSANQPEVNAQIAGTTVSLPVDTGSRGLYVSVGTVPAIDNATGWPGSIYLNSSARIFYGTWSNQTITFPDAAGQGTGNTPAQAVVPVLVVNTLACSTTPAPGTAVASTTFRTTAASGNVTLTNGQIRAFSNFLLTLEGGEAVSYLDNPGLLAPVRNFGVGFDRTGLGTSPTNNAYNQQYNAFLNVPQMRTTPPTMRAGYVLTPAGIQLGLTANTTGFAYTNLIPTGLAQNPPSPPDWQAPMGTVTFNGTTYPTGQLVMDTGIPFSILTLPGLGGATATPPLTVSPLNSGGAVSYTITANASSPLDPTSIEVFPPLAGVFSENQGTTRDQFFNTGRRIFQAFNYLYDGVAGYIGLAPNGGNATVTFTPGYYPAPIPPSPQTVTIPLAIKTVAGDASSPTPIYKLGIYVGLGGGAPKLYEFDTGGGGFFAAQNNKPGSWWPASSYTVNDGNLTFNSTYSSGITYVAQSVNTQVGLYTSADPGSLVASVNATVGQIIEATTRTGNSSNMLNWPGYENNPANAPVWQNFYGDFGVNPNPYNNTNGNATVTLSSILSQLPGNLSSGFIISMGGYASPAPTLRLGLTAADRASFPIQLPLLDPNPALPYPNSGYPSYSLFQTWGYFSLSRGSATQTAPTEVVFDTGAPTMTIRTGAQLSVDGSFLTATGNKFSITPGTNFSLVSNAWNLSFTANQSGGLNAVEVGPSVNAQNLGGYINTGLNAFFAYDVMYDIERGVIGFRSATPLPALPVVRIDGPKVVRTTTTLARITGRVRSAAAISTVLFRVNKGPWHRTQGGGKSWTVFQALRVGRSVIEVRAEDAFGQTGPIDSVTYVRQKSRPRP